MNAAERILADAGPTVSVPEAAQVLGISEWLAYKLINRGEFPAKVLPLGARKRVSTASLRGLLAAA
ncbi:helix-turn-helix transcriptional regulator [Amycolatopsis japonica]|uniref:helix-turn-helix transcriptional regulator n=1 Tax=Amycolatopsis japonica TaxID=208439 RepID=UPI00366CB601